jgi:uroporphyrinogen-III synthase
MKPLTGASVLVTRPAGQTVGLACRIAAAGGRAFVFPAIDVQAIEPSTATIARLNAIMHYDLVIFISPNAVKFALPLIEDKLQLSAKRLAATGSGTARALTEAGLKPYAVPARGSGSEALLSLPELQQVAGHSMLIVRGKGGREQLAESLHARGAQVDYAEVYQRLPPAGNPDELAGWLMADKIDAVLVTSGEALANLTSILPAAPRARLLQTQLVVSSRRLAQKAVSLSAHHPPVLAADAGDAALVTARAQWWESEGGKTPRSRRPG